MLTARQPSAGRHDRMELVEMTQPNAPAGWYRDPTGRHELRYFSGQWTQHVSTRGVTSIDPLTASPAPAASAPQPDLNSALETSQRSPKFKLAIFGGVVAV